MFDGAIDAVAKPLASCGACHGYDPRTGQIYFVYPRRWRKQCEARDFINQLLKVGVSQFDGIFLSFYVRYAISMPIMVVNTSEVVPYKYFSNFIWKNQQKQNYINRWGFSLVPVNKRFKKVFQFIYKQSTLTSNIFF